MMEQATQGRGMLSRVAESIYWMSRYIERAENIARLIDVNLYLNLDIPSDKPARQWEPLVRVTGDDAWFTQQYGKPTEQKVIQFLTFDRDYPNSIASCLQAARENARSIREIISSEMWEQINSTYLYFRDFKSGLKPTDSPYHFFRRVKMSCHLFSGLMESTMSHGEPWHFAKIGQYLERADKTSRILDMKYFIILPSIDDVGSPYDNIQWSALLKSASALEMYRKRWNRIDSHQVADFLILNREFPRAIHYCLVHAERSLHSISGSQVWEFSNSAEKLLGQLRSELDYALIDDIIHAGLHEFLDGLQSRLNQVGAGIHETYFSHRLPPPVSTQPQN